MTRYIIVTLLGRFCGLYPDIVPCATRAVVAYGITGARAVLIVRFFLRHIDFCRVRDKSTSIDLRRAKRLSPRITIRPSIRQDDRRGEYLQVGVVALMRNAKRRIDETQTKAFPMELPLEGRWNPDGGA